MTTKRLERTAYHEAGHAVARYVLHGRLRYVTIVPDPDEGSLGHCTGASLPSAMKVDVEHSSRYDRILEREITILLVGQAAEWRFTGRHNRSGSENDLHRAIDCALYLVGSDEELDAYVNLMEVRAKGFVAQPDHWAAIEALAAALLQEERIGYRRARQIIRDAWFTPEHQTTMRELGERLQAAPRCPATQVEKLSCALKQHSDRVPHEFRKARRVR